MNTVSLCMIVRDEESTLPRCLASVAGVADEIVVVDTGSIDDTKSVARRFTDRVYDFTWVDDFAAARNFAFSKSTCDFTLWLDADDILLPEDAARLRALKDEIPPEVNLVMLRYNIAFDAAGRPTFSYYRERLVRRSVPHVWREPVHEYLDAAGPRMTTDIAVTHAKPPGASSGGRNLRIYESRLAQGETLSPRGVLYYARELRDHGRHAEAIPRFRAFLDEGRGWVEDNITACGDLAGCLLAEGRGDEALAALLRSFTYDLPRAELCCQLGYLYKGREDYRRAAFWFGLALETEPPQGSWGFEREDCRGFLPCIELAVCYAHLGQMERAAAFNERAAQFKPDDPSVLHNRKFFAGEV